METQQEKSLVILELPQVLEQLSSHAVSETAKQAARELRPSPVQSEVRRRLAETSAAAGMMVLKGSPSFYGIKDVRSSLSRADLGGMLNTIELLDIAKVLSCARSIRTYGENDRTLAEKTVIDHLFASLQPDRHLEEKITSSIVGEDEIADAASAELATIRRQIRAATARARESLQKIISSSAYAKALQEPIITTRAERYVVPVKAEHRGEIPGLVHDVSASGATLFVEPMASVKANNELRELRAKEKAEIERILLELSADCAARRTDIDMDYLILTQLDLIFAKAKLSYQMGGMEPELSNGTLRLMNARHPLLPKETAVPITVSLGEEFDTMVVTGPNTGGKTVTLKTIGLLNAMAQCGMHIPVSDGSCVPVFRCILADIGDEQSIEQSLSTFSSHMTNIVRILNECGEGSLVLFDELGAGTDPTEGAALAVAVIEAVRRRGAFVTATTHYAELKVYATTSPGVVNASCEFDVETLRPTYRLLTGIPGKSNAFAISRRLGLPEAVISAARQQLSGEGVRFEDVLTQLEAKRQALEKREIEADRLLRQREEDARKAREFREQMERAKENARGRGEAEAKRILRDARAAADEVFAELAEMRRQQARAERNADENEARAALRRRLNEAEETVSRRDGRKESIPKPSRPIQAGDLVEIPGVRTPAEVVSVGKDGTLQLKSGILKMKAQASEVRLIEEDERAARKKAPAAIRQSAGQALRAAAARELDIRGLETLEAEAVVENFLSAAVMGKLETVTIIHGKGTGALRKAVHDVLRRNKAVKGFRLGVYGEGESGVTVVTMK